MEQDSIERAAPTAQLLNLIRDERGWKVGETEAGGRSRNAVTDAEEDRKLELKLGLPDVQGEEKTARPGEKIEQDDESYDTALSLACFPAHSKLSTNSSTTGEKRGFFATVDAKPQGCNRQRHRDRGAYENELTLGGQKMAGERKKGCCPPSSSSHDSAARPLRSSSNTQGRGAALPVVGWPPVRSIRRNLTNGSSSKQSPERQNDEAANKEKVDCKRSLLVKINMDGIPIGRKINLAAYDSFQKLSSAAEDLFRGFLQAQKDLAYAESGEQGAEEKIFSGLLDGTGEYTLVYEDNAGGRTLDGNLPWT